MKENFIKVKDVRLRYFEYGSPKLPTILFLHGFHNTAKECQTICGYLEKTFHVISPDLPGFGPSEELPKGLNAADAALLYLDMLELLGQKTYYVSGTSYGATIILEMLKTINISMLLGLVLLNPLYSYDALRLSSKRYLKLIINLVKRIPFCEKAFVNKVLGHDERMKKVFTFLFKIRDPRALAYRLHNLRHCSPSTYFYALYSVFNYLPKNVPTVPIKTLLVIDKEDTALKFNYTCEKFLEILPNVEIVLVTLESHNPETKPSVEEIERMLPNFNTKLKSFFHL